MVDIDAIMARVPADRTAGQVVSQSGEHWNPVISKDGKVEESDIPLPTASVDSFFSEARQRLRFSSLVGRKLENKFTVIGMAAIQKKGEKKPKRMVVRCECGVYAYRNIKSVEDPDVLDGCLRCRKRDFITGRNRTSTQQFGSEQALEQSVCDAAEREGWLVRKVKWIGNRGAPDRCFIRDNRIVFIEFKAAKNEVRNQQEREFKRIKSQYSDTYVCKTKNRAREILGLKTL